MMVSGYEEENNRGGVAHTQNQLGVYAVAERALGVFITTPPPPKLQDPVKTTSLSYSKNS